MIEEVRRRVEAVDHWELVVLMALTMGAIATLYAVGVAFAWSLFATVDFALFLALGAVFAVALMGFQYWYTKRSYRKASAELSESDAPELHRAADELAAEMDIARPELRVVDDPTPNALAVGRRGDGIVVFHSGLFDAMDQAEIEAITAHEFAHLRNRDSVVTGISQAIRRLLTRGAWLFAVVTTMIAAAAAAAMTEGESRAQAQRRQRRQQKLIAGITTFVALLVMVFSRALSRYREYVADLTAAKAMGDPQPMASALRRLDAATDGGAAVADEGGSSLHIVNEANTSLYGLFSTHPALDSRISVLESADERGYEEVSIASQGRFFGFVRKFGLTAAPVAIVGVGGLEAVSTVVALIQGTATESASDPSMSGLVALAVLVVGLTYFFSLFALPIAQLIDAEFPDTYGLASLGAVAGYVVALAPSGALAQGVKVCFLLGLIVSAGHVLKVRYVD